MTTGQVDERVADAMERALELGEIGLSVAASVGETIIVDACAGFVDPERTRRVDPTTLFPVFSLTKAVTATALHLQVVRGLIDYEAPVADYWPEFGAGGKSEVTVRHVLTHRSGVPHVPADISVAMMRDWDRMTRGLASLELLFPSGSRNAYSPLGFGWIVGEVVRRTDPKGRSFGRFVAEEVAGPLGMDDWHLGLAPELHDRVATLSFPEPPSPAPRDSLLYSASPPQVDLNPEHFNRRDVREAVLPGVGGISTATGLLPLFGMLAQGGRWAGHQFLPQDLVESFLEPRSAPGEDDITYGRPMPVGGGAYWTAVPNVSASGPLTGRILAHTAAGGTIGWADLDTGLAVVICHNRMFFQPSEPPFAALGDAIREVAQERS